MGSTIAILGGTGAEGRGLALRFVQAGLPVIIGSRQAERARTAAAEINGLLSASLATGAENGDAATRADLVVLTIPFEGIGDTVEPLAEALADKTVISTVVPLAFAKGVPRLVPVPEGSAAQQIQALLPETTIMAAFHHLSSQTLADLSQPVDADVLVCGDEPEAKEAVIALTGKLSGARGIDAGPLEGAFYLEAFTAVLLRINRRYRAHAGVRITHLPTDR